MSDDSIVTVNPATGRVIERYTPHTDAQVSSIAERCAAQQRQWARVPIEQRALPLVQLAEQLRAHREALAKLMAQEMGKPVTGGLAEVDKCAWLCEHYAEHGVGYLTPQHIATDAKSSFVASRPLGVVLAVMPWNYPLWQALRAAVPTMVAGNGMLLKHASNVPGCALEIERLFAAAGFPEGLMATLLVEGKRAAALAERKDVAAVTLTGSEPAGRAVAEAAGRALKKCVLELGGSDPYVILADANIEHAAKVCASARLTNGGQSCIAAKRFIVVEAVAKAFSERVVHHMREAKVGDPMDPATEVGPMARVDLRDELHDQVRRSIDAGGKLLLGGTVPDQDGAWYPATVVANVRPGSPIFVEETFGPVAPIIVAADQAEAIQFANDSDFGLGAAVFTADLREGERIATQELQAGMCFVNAAVKSDPRLPFGGIKNSGIGRELGAHGIHEFTNEKTVYIGQTD